MKYVVIASQSGQSKTATYTNAETALQVGEKLAKGGAIVTYAMQIPDKHMEAYAQGYPPPIGT